VGVYAVLRFLRGDDAGGALTPQPTEAVPHPFNLPRNDYRIVLADPPWQYESWRGKSKDTSKRRVVEDEYDTMPLDAIKALPVAQACAKDAVLLLWATLPLLQEGLDVLKAWGFQYRTAFLVWGKLNADGRTPAVGFGRYTRSNGELCLLGRKGDGVKPNPGVAIANLVLSQRGKHSAKPDRQYEIIDAVFGREVPRVELFARKRMPRWDVWGLEAPEHVATMDLEAAG
jgi:N6-adenosine-specific RNA methylase IME4